ncbi:keratin, type I cytoskeletal 9-like [Vigna radiata var. radiata]|uniref:Keratin, type I cytoskeletal 9-like n=1 Tax=Vigna radiata var. radiata TaxID=3916 RepID=A0A1S3TDI3_VIGRR|nr:keratin, type I cytoskeletal 9-like [Vigna radiata var. radiata]
MVILDGGGCRGEGENCGDDRGENGGKGGGEDGNGCENDSGEDRCENGGRGGDGCENNNGDRGENGGRGGGGCENNGGKSENGNSEGEGGDVGEHNVGGSGETGDIDGGGGGGGEASRGGKGEDDSGDGGGEDGDGVSKSRHEEGLETSKRPRTNKSSREPSLENNKMASHTGEGGSRARRTLVDYTTVVGPHRFNSIARPKVNAANMEMKPALIQLLHSMGGCGGLIPQQILPTKHGSSDNETLSERGMPSQTKGVFQLEPYDALLAQNKIITQQLEILTKKVMQPQKEHQNVAQFQQQLCELCGGDHINGQCAMPENLNEEVNYMGNQNQFRPNNYNQGWRSHPSNGPGQFGQTDGQYYKPPHQQQQWQQQPPSSDMNAQLQETLNQFM